MPFRERSAWGSLICTVSVYGLYFAILMPRLQDSAVTQPHYVGLLFACVVALIVFQVAFQAAIAIMMRDQARVPMDERERFIALKSDRVALGVLTTLLGFGWLGYLAGPDITTSHAVLANALLFALVVSALTKYASQIFYFHREL